MGPSLVTRWQVVWVLVTRWGGAWVLDLITRGRVMGHNAETRWGRVIGPKQSC